MSELKQTLSLKLGEQLVGLSPTVCRRVLTHLEEILKGLKSQVQEVGGVGYIYETPVTPGDAALIRLLANQTNIEGWDDCVDHGGGVHSGKVAKLEIFLGEVEYFLDIVEGVEPK